MRKTLLTLLLVLIAATGLFASGAREVTADERVVLVLSVEVEDGGVYRLTVQDQDGNVVIYRADAVNTVLSVPLEQVSAGSVLALKDNGIMTMSIPPQMYATELRDLTLGVAAGAYDFTFAELDEMGQRIVAAQDDANVLWPMELGEGIEERFSYAYGYNVGRDYTAQDVTFRASYYARGVLDFWNGVAADQLLMPIESMSEAVNTYIDTVYSQNIPENVGPSPRSMDEIYAIEGFEDDDLSQRFSYAYGYVTAFQDYYYGIAVDPEAYVMGILSQMYGVTPLLDEGERVSAVTDYINQLQEQYNAYLAELATTNLERAEAFLAENAAVEGIVTTASGLQLETVSEGTGATPSASDTVTVNYSLRDIDGNTIDYGNEVSFPLSNLIPGFSEAVQNMKVGGETIAYVHPSLGYGEAGAGTVGPNSLLIFDIELVGIDEPSEG